MRVASRGGVALVPAPALPMRARVGVVAWARGSAVDDDDWTGLDWRRAHIRRDAEPHKLWTQSLALLPHYIIILLLPCIYIYIY